MQNQEFNSWSTVWLIIVGGFITTLLVIRLVEWIRKPLSFSQKMSLISSRLSKAGLYGKVTPCLKIIDGRMDFIDGGGYTWARVHVLDIGSEKLVIVSCDMSSEAVSIFREVLATNGSGLHFRKI